MVNEVEKQVINHLKKANRILLALPINANGDAVGSGLAMAEFLRKLDKEPELVCANPGLSGFDFLSGFNQIKKQLEVDQSFVISVDTKQIKLDELSYDTHADRVDIFLKPKEGKFSEKNISFRNARFPFDLIITLDASSLDHLGNIYEQNADLFFETTIINIDHHPNNEQYGEINLVDLTATSTAEVLATLISDFEASLMDNVIATNLLTGIIVETNSFQHVKTTPRAFLRASSLVEAGADQQEIIRQLYKTKNISLLKLWGRALARLRQVDELSFVYSILGKSDLEKSGAQAQDVLSVMKEMVANLAGSRMVLLLAELQNDKIVGYYSLHPGIKSQIVASLLSGEMLNGSMGKFEMTGKTLTEAEKEVLERLYRIKDQLAS